MAASPPLFDTLVAPLMGLIGVLLGIAITEVLTRRRRVEVYAQKLFEKRLEVHEALFKLVREAEDATTATFDDPDLTAEERREMISPSILALASFCDDNGLYIDSHVGASLTCVFIGADDIGGIDDAEEKALAMEKYYRDAKQAREMVIAESGIRAINEHFKLVSKSKPDSAAIRRIKELEDDRRRK